MSRLTTGVFLVLAAVSAPAMAHSGHHEPVHWQWLVHMVSHADHLLAWLGLATGLAGASLLWRYRRQLSRPSKRSQAAVSENRF